MSSNATASMAKYTPPKFQDNNFHCPHCGVHARHYWFFVYVTLTLGHAGEHFPQIRVSRCNACNEYIMWHQSNILFPFASSAPMPGEDMPEDVTQDYVEARNVLNYSPRSSAALLRLALQKLMPHLGEPGKNLNDDIASLVKKGLAVQIQQALDAVRVVGNNAVHPGELDLRDDTETAGRLFELLNLIVDVTITQPRRVAELYDKLPEGARRAIEERDKAD